WISGVEKTNFQVSEEEKFKSFDLGLAVNGGIMYFINQELFLSAALATYVGALDLNGQSVQDFVSLNDVKYRQSRNARAGLQIGIHYFFADYRRNMRW
ncbi:MAG: hypothetical protein HKN22_01705, partial [Bacteroidia bacterium]|nr:hypothetical protein [Bacteroidia bacterium]